MGLGLGEIMLILIVLGVFVGLIFAAIYLNSPKNSPSIAEGLDGDEFGVVGASPTMNCAYKAL